MYDCGRLFGYKRHVLILEPLLRSPLPKMSPSHPADSFAEIEKRHRHCLKTDLSKSEIRQSREWLRPNKESFDWYLVVWGKKKHCNRHKIIGAVALGELTPRAAKSVFDLACEDFYDGSLPHFSHEGEYVDSDGNWFGTGFRRQTPDDDLCEGYCLYRSGTRLFNGIWKRVKNLDESFRRSHRQESESRLNENQMRVFRLEDLLAKALRSAELVHGHRSTPETLAVPLEKQRKNKGGRPRGGGKTVNEKLMDHIKKYPFESGKTANEFAQILGCSVSAIKQTKTGKS